MATPTVDTKIWLALRARVASLTPTPTLPVLWPGVAAELPSGRCIRVRHLVNRPIRQFHSGSDPHQRRGVLQIDLIVEPDATNAQFETAVREIAGDIAGHFPTGLPMRRDDLTVKVIEAPEVSQGVVDDKMNRYVIPISIRWEVFA